MVISRRSAVRSWAAWTSSEDRHGGEGFDVGDGVRSGILHDDAQFALLVAPGDEAGLGARHRTVDDRHQAGLGGFPQDARDGAVLGAQVEEFGAGGEFGREGVLQVLELFDGCCLYIVGLPDARFLPDEGDRQEQHGGGDEGGFVDLEPLAGAGGRWTRGRAGGGWPARGAVLPGGGLRHRRSGPGTRRHPARPDASETRRRPPGRRRASAAASNPSWQACRWTPSDLVGWKTVSGTMRTPASAVAGGAEEFVADVDLVAVPEPDHGDATGPHAVVAGAAKRAPHGHAQFDGGAALVAGDVGEVLAAEHAQAAADDPVRVGRAEVEEFGAGGGLDGVRASGQVAAQAGAEFVEPLREAVQRCGELVLDSRGPHHQARSSKGVRWTPLRCACWSCADWVSPGRASVEPSPARRWGPSEAGPRGREPLHASDGRCPDGGGGPVRRGWRSPWSPLKRTSRGIVAHRRRWGLRSRERR